MADTTNRASTQPYGLVASIAGFAFAVLVLAIAMTFHVAPLALATASFDDPRRWLYLATNYPSSTISLATVSVGLLTIMFALWTRGGQRFGRLRLWRMLRIVFAPRYLAHRSHRLDALFMIGNATTFALMFGWLVVSGSVISTTVFHGLTAVIGHWPRTTLSPTAIGWIGAGALYLAYEFGYWLVHTMAHRVPALWEFHRVHHEAEVLSPLTGFRVHPIDSVVFMNVLAVVGGTTYAVLHVLLGVNPGDVTFYSQGLILAVFAYVFQQLHHINLWIPLTGFLGRILISPAHHQIHHSCDPLHHDKNMGSNLAIFDWMFGTLFIPSRKRQKLTLGVPRAANEQHDPQSLEGAFVAPFVRGAGHLTTLVPTRATPTGTSEAV